MTGLIPYALAAIVGVSYAGGRAIAQASTLTYDSPISLAIMVASVTAAFAVGAVLTGIKRDIKELKGKISELPCHHCRKHVGEENDE
jgi:hypothetical protein